MKTTNISKYIYNRFATLTSRKIFVFIRPISTPPRQPGQTDQITCGGLWNGFEIGFELALFSRRPGPLKFL